jgi:hypothetical protein
MYRQLDVVAGVRTHDTVKDAFYRAYEEVFEDIRRYHYVVALCKAFAASKLENPSP